MNTKQLRTGRLVLLMGIALIAACFTTAASYRNLERKAHSAEVFIPTYRCLYNDLELCSALKAIHEGDVIEAARRLDQKLCEDIVALNAQLAAADTGDVDDRAFVRNAFARFALIRPKSAELLGNTVQPLRSDQIEAEKILAQACAGSPDATKATTAAP